MKKSFLIPLLFVFNVNLNAFPVTDPQTILSSAWDYMTKNIQDSLSQWTESTYKNGVNSASSGLKECIGELDTGILDALGMSVELPCGGVWSVDSPIEDIVNSISSDFTSSINSSVKKSVDDVFKYLDITDKSCVKKDLNLTIDTSYFKTLSDEEFKKLMSKRFSNQCGPNKERYQNNTNIKNPYDNELPKSSFGSGSNINNIIADQRKEQDERRKKEIYKKNKQLAEQCPTDPNCNYILLNGETVQETKIKQAMFSNCDQLKSEEERKKCRLDKIDYESAQEDMEEENKINLIKQIESTRIPLTLFYGIKNEKSTTTDGIFKQEWNSIKSTPNMSIVYISPLEITGTIKTFDKNDLNKEKEEKINNKQVELTLGDGNKISINKILKGDINTIPSSAKEDWKHAVNSLLYENGSFKQWNSVTAMQLLIIANDLVIAQIQNLGAENPNFFLNMVQKRSILYSQFILADVLEKQNRLSLSSISNGTIDDSNTRMLEYLNNNLGMQVQALSNIVETLRGR